MSRREQYLVTLEIRVDRELTSEQRERLVTAIKRACDGNPLPYAADVVTDTQVEHLGGCT